MANINKNSHPARKRRLESRKRKAKSRHSARIQNNKLSLNRIIRRKDKPDKQPIDRKVWAANFIRKNHLQDGILIIDKYCYSRNGEIHIVSLLYNSNSDFVCELSDEVVESIAASTKKVAKTA